MKDKELRRLALDKLKKLAERYEKETPSLPLYTGTKLDLYGLSGCARIEGRPTKFVICLNCLKFDRANMVCAVGKEAK